MTRNAFVRGASRDGPRADTTGMGRFELRALLGWVALLAGAVPFLLLWLLVQRSWAPLTGLDGEVAAALNEVVGGRTLLVSVLSAVTDLGGAGVSVLVLTLTTVFLLVRRQRRLAAWVATTGVGLAVLVPVTKAVIDRARPVVDSPVVDTPSNASFPSGHAMTALVTYGVLLLLVLPSVRRRTRPWLVAAAALLVLVVGATRLALGVHFVSDVLAGWTLGAAWLAVTTAAFRGWQHSRGRHVDEPLDPLDVPPDGSVDGVRAADPALPGGRTTALRLLAALVAVCALVTGLGLLVTGALLDTWVGRLDRSLVRWSAEQRSPGLTTVVELVGHAGGTRTVVAVGLALAVLGVAVAASWRPVVFVVVTLVGEVTAYLVSSQLVGRMRPQVPDLTAGLPTGASWPSGHAAAAVAVYGALAALVLAHGRARRRRWVLALPLVLGLAVGAARVYTAAHHPTDVLAGLLLGGLWVWTCARLLLPRPGTGARAGTTTPERS
jgi:undecaprenyl-diphosphatase